MPSEALNINIDDSVLVEQCQRDDTAAMERLILKYQDRIYNVILKICANTDDAAELTQETFVKIIENIDKFQGRSSFYTWAFRIAVNLTISYCKRNVKLGFRSLDDEGTNKTEQARKTLRDFLVNDKASDPAIIVQNKEIGQIITETLMKLDEPQRSLIVLRDIEGMDYAQIAKVFNTKLGTIKSRLSRARSNLRDILEVIVK